MPCNTEFTALTIVFSQLKRGNKTETRGSFIWIAQCKIFLDLDLSK